MTSTIFPSPELWQQEVHATVDRLAVYLSTMTESLEQDLMEARVVRDIAQMMDALSLITTAFAQYTQNATLLTTASILRTQAARHYTAHYNHVKLVQSTLLGTESQT